MCPGKAFTSRKFKCFCMKSLFWGDFQQGSFHICSIKRVLEQKMDKLFDDGSEHSALALSKYSKKKKNKQQKPTKTS